VEPQSEGNIGSVCRAMKTMGIEELAIVEGRDYGREYDENGVLTLALHARDIWQKALHFPDLASALQDCTLSAGVTRRRGKFRKYFSLLPEEFARRVLSLTTEVSATGSSLDHPQQDLPQHDQAQNELAQHDQALVAAVFGREADGLTDEELNSCSLAVHIPSSPAFPSLNLSHAVQIICYELFRAEHPSTISFKPISQGDVEELSETVVESFDQIGFFKQDERDEVKRFFRDMFLRSTLSSKESQRLEKMFRKMAGIKIHKTEPS